jgi:hypothetical protein
MGSQQSILDAIDKEIARLREVRKVLAKNGKIAAKRTAKASTPGKKTAKRKLSPESRARIAEAQRKRWAAARKAAK